MLRTSAQGQTLFSPTVIFIPNLGTLICIDRPVTPGPFHLVRYSDLRNSKPLCVGIPSGIWGTVYLFKTNRQSDYSCYRFEQTDLQGAKLWPGCHALNRYTVPGIFQTLSSSLSRRGSGGRQDCLIRRCKYGMFFA